MPFNIQFFGGSGASLGGGRLGKLNDYSRNFKSDLSKAELSKKITSLGNVREVNRYLRKVEEKSHSTFSARMNTIENTRDKRKDALFDAYNEGRLSKTQYNRLLKRERRIYAKARNRIDAINRKELSMINKLNKD